MTTNLGQQVTNRGEFVDGLSTHRRVDLDGKAGRSSGFDGSNRLLETAVFAAESVVSGGRGTVETDGHPFETRIDHLLNPIGGQRAGPARRNRHPQPGSSPWAISSSTSSRTSGSPPEEDDQLAVAEVGGLLEQRFPLGCREFVGMASGLGVGPTVIAGEPAGLGEFPDEDERSLGCLERLPGRIAEAGRRATENPSRSRGSGRREDVRSLGAVFPHAGG